VQLRGGPLTAPPGGQNGGLVIYRLTTYKQNLFRPTKYPTSNRFIMI